MFSSAILLANNGNNEGLTGPSGPMDKTIARDLIVLVVVAVIIDLVVLIFAIHYILECAKNNKWNPLITLLLIMMLFLPGIGGALAIAIIIYGVTGGCKPAQPLSFSFF